MKLSQIAEIISGHPFRTKIANEGNGNTLVLQMKDISVHGIDWQKTVKTELYNIKAERYIKEGDILLIARGSRNTSILIDNIEQPTIFSPHFFLLRTLVNSNINPAYLNWYLNQLSAQKYFECSAQGSNIRCVGREVLADMNIPIIPLKQQHSIVALANKLYQHQAKLQQLINNDQRILDGIAQSLMPSLSLEELYEHRS